MAFYSRVGNFAAVAWCSLCVAILGLLMMVTGAIVTGIAYTEITPPNYDENYNRYLGSNIPRIVGPLLLGFGGVLLFGSCGLFLYAFFHSNKEYRKTETGDF